MPTEKAGYFISDTERTRGTAVDQDAPMGPSDPEVDIVAPELADVEAVSPVTVPTAANAPPEENAEDQNRGEATAVDGRAESDSI